MIDVCVRTVSVKRFLLGCSEHLQYILAADEVVMIFVKNKIGCLVTRIKVGGVGGIMVSSTENGTSKQNSSSG